VYLYRVRSTTCAITGVGEGASAGHGNAHATMPMDLGLAEQAHLYIRNGQRLGKPAEGGRVRVAVRQDDGRRCGPQLSDVGNRQTKDGTHVQ
jgi:hypothetical protein